MKKDTTYQIYGSLKEAYHAIERLTGPKWGYTVKEMEVGNHYILGEEVFWIKVTYFTNYEEAD